MPGRAGDLARLLAEVDDPGSRAAVTAERTVLAELEAGCSAPLGAYAAGPTYCSSRPPL